MIELCVECKQATLTKKSHYFGKGRVCKKCWKGFGLK